MFCHLLVCLYRFVICCFDVLLYTQGNEYDSGGRIMNEFKDIQHLSLFRLAQEATTGLMSTSVATLLAISNGIEDAVIDHQLRGVFYAGFQRISSFMPQVERFAQLAAACGEVVIFAEPDVAPPTIPGVNFVLLEPDAPLAEEWFIVFAHPALGMTLLTREIHAPTEEERRTSRPLGRGRYYKGALLCDLTVVRRAAVSLRDALAAETAPHTDLPKVPPPYTSFLQSFAGNLEERNRELQALYQTLQERKEAVDRLNRIVKTMMSRTAWEEATFIRDAPAAASPRTQQQTLSVLNTDIAGFTTMSESMDVTPLVKDLNRYLDMLATTVYQSRGDVDKFLGDGMLAFFERPRDALAAALRIQQRVAAFNAQQIAADAPAFPTRVGLMTGPCLIAGVGSRARQEVTILGDTVNTASRLQGLAPTGGVLMDEMTYQACGAPDATAKRVDVRGKQGRQSVYEIAPDEIDAILAALAEGPAQETNLTEQ